ncbi:hypothetical protein CHCC20335_2371 [Bacillus paralicheniformis]|nr:hypothetical protein CHCC20335_2371 [Bacillus paralicheniformis]
MPRGKIPLLTRSALPIGTAPFQYEKALYFVMFILSFSYE